MQIKPLLEAAINRRASDLHLITKSPPILRIDGALHPIAGQEVLTKEQVKELIFSMVNQEQKEIFLVNKELDFSFALGDQARFRVNIYHQKGELAAALRLISTKIPAIKDLNLPEICHSFTKLKQGFILVVGPTGHGKSTTLASIVEQINQSRAEHIVTIEDPIEYVFDHAKSIISQREMKADTHSWPIALRSCLREDPNVVMIGEMRDLETMSMSLTIAETGHLVFSTLHTNSVAQSLDRIIDVFPEHQQEQVRIQLSATIEAIVSQRLLPCLEGGRIPATEVLVATPAIRTAIREGKTHMIDNIVQTSAEMGMWLLETDLARLVKTGRISLETAQTYALRPEEVMRLTRGR
jgi:twitching motility protein PilT